MSRTITTTLSVEIELTVQGVYQPGYPETGPTYACGGEPAEPDGVEDVECVGLIVDRRRTFYETVAGSGALTPVHTGTFFNILDGVNMTPDVRRLLTNLAAAFDGECVDALIGAVSE